jgi:hypothetical protein
MLASISIALLLPVVTRRLRYGVTNVHRRLLFGLPLRCTAASHPLSIGPPAAALRLCNSGATSFRLWTRRFATVKAATIFARFRSHLTIAAGPGHGSTKRLLFPSSPHGSSISKCHLKISVVRPHDARAFLVKARPRNNGDFHARPKNRPASLGARNSA